jgi:hypothetical protein
MLNQITARKKETLGLLRKKGTFSGTKKQQTTFKDSFNKIASFIVQKKQRKKKSDLICENRNRDKMNPFTPTIITQK